MLQEKLVPFDGRIFLGYTLYTEGLQDAFWGVVQQYSYGKIYGVLLS